jgi:UDP-N-acetylmuramoyl-L-alanyl-D-glutamate--2,6-diaminopimelate ligase
VIRLSALLDGLDAEYHGCEASLAVERVSADSRQVAADVAFLAVRGGTVDGHDYLKAALQGGAPVLIVERGREVPPNAPHVTIPSTSDAMPIIAANLHDWPGRKLRLAGITGTNGKTTTAHLLGAVLEVAGRNYARLGTTGNWMVDHEQTTAFTTPFPLELQALLANACDLGATDAVMEVSSHALDQGRVQPLRYQAAALTSFSQDHLDYHPSMEEYLRAKTILPARLMTSSGTVVAVAGSRAAETFLAAAPAGIVRWRASKDAASKADLLARDWAIDATGIRARVHTPAGGFDLRSPLVGDFNLDNLLVTTGLALGLGVELDAIAAALSKSRGAPGRLERVAVETAAGPAVFVDYAHTPDAVARAIEALRPTCRGRLIVLLGCGGDRDQKKRPLMGRAASEGGDLFYATSDNPRTEDPAFIVDQMLEGVGAGAQVVREVDRSRAIAQAIAEADERDTVLIAGKGHEDYQILGTEKIHFDDREHAAAALRTR